MKRAIIIILFLFIFISYGCGSKSGSGPASQGDTEKQNNQEQVMDNITSDNTAPTANAGADKSVNEGSLVILDGSGSTDPDLDTLTYLWIQTAGPIVTLINSSTATPSFMSPSVYSQQKLSFQLTVSDGKLQSSDTITVTVNNTINDLPIANAGPDKTTETGSIVTLSGSVSLDPNGDSLTYQWILKSIPDGSSTQLISANTVSPSFIPDVEGDYIIQLVVNDGKDNSAPDEIKVTAIRPKKITLKGPINTTLRYRNVHYLGQIINETDNPACFIEITIDSMDAQGNLLDTDFTYVDGSTMTVSDIIYTDTCLRPGEVGGFEIYTNLTQVPPKFVYIINHSSSKVSEPVVLPSQVIIDGQITETTDYSGNLKLMGFIKNLHPTLTLQFVEIDFVALHGDTVVDTEFTYINGSTCVLSYGGSTDTCLTPGESRSFSASLDVPPTEITGYYYKINYDVAD